MGQLSKAFSGAKEDYLSTRHGAVDIQVEGLELYVAFGRLLAIQFWAAMHFRILTGVLAVALIQLPTFIQNATLFGLITFYLQLPFSLLPMMILGVRFLLALILMVDVSGLDFLKMGMLLGEISQASLLPIAMAVLVGMLWFVVVVSAKFVRKTKQTIQGAVVILTFYLIVLSSFLISLCTEDQQILGWLSFGVLISFAANLLRVGVKTNQTQTSMN